MEIIELDLRITMDNVESWVRRAEEGRSRVERLAELQEWLWKKLEEEKWRGSK
jgi:hypothetical protein